MSLRVVIPLFDGITALDAIGPYEVLSRLPGAEVLFAALEPGPQWTDRREVALVASTPSPTWSRPTCSWCPAASARGRC